MSRRGLLLVNLGTPEKPTLAAVKTYLREFLTDPRVIDIPLVLRFLLVYLIIVPFRAKKSLAAYLKVWQPEGSPLLFYSERFKDKLEKKLGMQYSIQIAMRYGTPSIKETVEKFEQDGISNIQVVPMFPQYASASWGSAAVKVLQESSKKWNTPALDFVPPFYQHHAFISAVCANTKPFLDQYNYEKILISFHGLPERHVFKSDCTKGKCTLGDCCSSQDIQTLYCYRAHCFKTAQAIATQLGIADSHFQVCFQSRLGRSQWLTPYFDKVVNTCLENNEKNILVISPSFVNDCLETIEEVGITAKESFIKKGGGRFDCVPALNDNDHWVDAFTQIIDS